MNHRIWKVSDMESVHRRRFHLTQAYVYLLIGIIAVSLAGCRDKNNAAAVRLSQTGVQTADNLTTYYDCLAEDAVCCWQMTTLCYSVEGAEDWEYEANNKNYRDIIHSLRARAHLARSISSAYKALNDLASYDAPGEMSEAAKGLGEAIGSIAPISDSGILPAQLFAAAGSELAAAQQSRDIKRGTRALSSIVNTTAYLFEKEKPIYDSILKGRAASADKLYSDLLHRNLAATKLLTAKVTKPLGLEWIEQPKAQGDANANRGILKLAAIQSELLEQDMAAMGLFTLQSLKDLSTSSNTFVTNGTANTAKIQDSLRKAQYYLNEASKIRGKE